jgi:hypothetical protein
MLVGNFDLKKYITYSNVHNAFYNIYEYSERTSTKTT